MKDSVGGNLEATSTSEQCLETAEESGSSDECLSNEPDIETVLGDEKVPCNNELESNEPEIITVTEDATCGSTEGGSTHHVNDRLGDEESASPTRTTHDADAMETSAGIVSPQPETCAQPTNLFTCEKSVEQSVAIDETSSHEEDLSGVVNEESQQSELAETTNAAQVTSEQSATLPSAADTESTSVGEEESCRDKAKFCDCLRSLKDLALPDVLRDLSSEEIFEAHHNLTEIMSVVVQALRGRWQSPRSKK